MTDGTDERNPKIAAIPDRETLNGELVDSFEKNASEEVQVRLRKYRGYLLVDTRVFAIQPTGKQPTKKGICIRVELIPRLIEALQKAGGAL